MLSKDVHPVHSTLYQAGPTTRKFVATEMIHMLRKEVIEPTATELASPIVSDPKKEDSLGICVEYRKPK